MVNVTNHCNLKCKHCFIFREGNPNQSEGEMKPERLLSELERLRNRHGVRFMMWMGGEPMLRWRVVEKGLSGHFDVEQPLRRLGESLEKLGVRYVNTLPALRALPGRVYTGAPGRVGAYLGPEGEEKLAEIAAAELLSLGRDEGS
jgi:hypothetical protein